MAVMLQRGREGGSELQLSGRFQLSEIWTVNSCAVMCLSEQFFVKLLSRAFLGLCFWSEGEEQGWARMGALVQSQNWRIDLFLFGRKVFLLL